MAPLSTYLHIINTFAYGIHHEEGIVQILFGPPSSREQK